MPGDAWRLAPRPGDAPRGDELGEGPVWDGAAGVLWWVDIAGGRLHRLDPRTGEVRSRRLGGHLSAVAPCRGGGLVAAMRDGLYLLDDDGAEPVLFARPDLAHDNRSNECRTDPQGRLWLGTMANNLAPDGAPLALPGVSGGLFRIGGDGEAHRVVDGVGISNTLAWSPAGDRMYFADTLLGVIWSFPFDSATGELGERRVFAGADAAPGAPDGSAVDADGCLWNARWGGGCVVRFAPDGRVDRVVETPVRQPTCPAFGGADLRTLYLTSARHGLPDLPDDAPDGALLAMETPVPGLPSAPFALAAAAGAVA